MTRFRLLLGDITQVEVEAIVNSTDTSLRAGGPVHEAVHRAAGPGLAQECRHIPGCPAGEARVTGGHDLPSPYVIHTVAPTWMGGRQHELNTLANCYRSCLHLAEKRGFQTIAFPSIGAGQQPQIPLDEAAPVVVRTLLQWVDQHDLPEQVIFVCLDPATFQIHQRILREMLP